MVAQGPTSGWHPLGGIISALAGRPAGIRAAVDSGPAVDAPTLLRLHQNYRPTTLAAASAIHT